MNGSCPTGYTLCSDQVLSKHDKVCVATESYPASCPILAIEFSDTSVTTIDTTPTGWTSLPFTDELTLSFTKTESTEGPLAETFVGREPCLVSQQKTNYPELKSLYKLERIGNLAKCNTLMELIPDKDPRYRKMNLFSVDEYAVQEASGVLATLEGLTKYSDDVPDINVKKQVLFNFFWRPAIRWTCSRAEMNEALKVMDAFTLDNWTRMALDRLSSAMYVGIAYVAMLLLVIIYICFTRMSSASKSIFSAMLCTFLCDALPVLVLTLGIFGMVHLKAETNQQYALHDAVQGCMIYSDTQESVLQHTDEITTASILLLAASSLIFLKLTICCVFC